MNIVADYSSSEEDCETPVQKKVILPPADQVFGTVAGSSVLESKYDKEVKDAHVILEQHVKLSETQKVTSLKRQVCYMFRKGRCKYGNNCKYYHDSTLLVKERSKNHVKENEDDDDKQPIPSKKRYGVTNTLRPPKKAMAKITQIQQREKFS